MQSKFFTMDEMTRSDAAMRHGIANRPDETATNNLQTLCAAVLDPLREAVGASININSAYRGPELNARIGGATRSQHMEGKAADIQSRAISVLELFKTVIRMNLPYDQVIYEAKNRTTKWVHVSHDPTRARAAILIADFKADGGVASYRTITAQQALAMTESATRSALPVELHYEELPDEPGLDDETAGQAPARTRPRRKKPAAKKAAPKKKAAARRKKAKRIVKTRKRLRAKKGK